MDGIIRLRRLMRGVLICAVAAAAAPHPLPAAEPLGTRPPAPQTGRVVIGFDPARSAAARSAVSASGAGVERSSASAGFMVVRPRHGESARSLARRLERGAGVRYAEPERVVQALFTPNDPRFSLQQNLTAIGARAAWDVQRGISSVVVAVIDSGVDLEHPDLAGRLDTTHDYDFVARDSVADDRFGHGTHVAGIVAANTDNRRDVAGIAPGCTILPVRVLDSHGTGTDTAVAEGIVHAVRNGADVINLSLGMTTPTRVVEDAVEYAHARDVVVVAAAGNSGVGWVDYPAAYPGVLAVGATDSSGDRWAYSQSGDNLDLVAPGVNVLSLRPVTGPVTDGPVGRLTGTSVASPHVAGVAALIRSAHPGWTAAAVTDTLLRTAQDLGPEGVDEWYGYGLVRADRALGSDGDISDDDLPGIALPASPVDGAGEAAMDPQDVYAVALQEGQRLEVALTGPVDARFSASLLDPSVRSIAGAVPLASAISTGTVVRFDHEVLAGESGVHLVVVTAEAGAGPYRLTWKRGYDTRVTVKAAETPPWGAAVSVRGRVLSFGDEPVAGVRVRLDAYPARAGAWRLSVAKAATDSDGIYRFRVNPTRRTTYRVRFLGVPGEFASTSDTKVVWPKAALSAPRPTAPVRRDIRFTLAGTLRPKHPEDARSVRITLWRKDPETGVWVHYRTTRAFNRNRDGYTRYIRRFTLPRGTWKFVASIDASTRHSAASATSYLAVR